VKIKLLENGLDSLRKGFKSLMNYEELYLLDNAGHKRFLVLKDAVLAIHHGIEILFKEVLIKDNELLIFSEIGKKLKDAFVVKKQRNLGSLFEADQLLHTVTFQEAIDRVQKICGHEINSKFMSKLGKLQEYRNQITHSEVSIDEVQLNLVFEGLVDEIDTFFIRAIGPEYTTVTGYSNFKANYQEYLSKLDKTKENIKKEAIEKYIEAFQKCNISMGEKEVKIITDINVVTKLINTLYDSNLRFGTDLYNGYCSGAVSIIKRLSDNRFSLYTKDNSAEFIFKFKSLLIYMPEISSEFSPIMFFEADKDKAPANVEKYVETDSYDRKSISGIYFNDEDRIEWEAPLINDFYNMMDDEYFVIPQHHGVEHFISSGVFCFINIQMLNYGNMKSILHDFGTLPLKKIEVNFRKSLNKEV